LPELLAMSTSSPAMAWVTTVALPVSR
jgi:hypothetical protein